MSQPILQTDIPGLPKFIRAKCATCTIWATRC